MAELACFCYPHLENDSYKFIPFNNLAIKAMLTAKVDKKDMDKFYDSIIYGIAPPPQFKKRYNTNDNSRGMNFETIMFTKVAMLICEALNSLKVTQANVSNVLSRVVSIRHLENLVIRKENPQDILFHSKDLLLKSTLIAIGQSKEIETTITAEGGEIVFQNAAFTMWKLTYLEHQLMPILDQNFIEYKVTLNEDKPISDVHVKELVAELRWQYNKFAVITHGKGHYRIVKYSSVANHADRVYATFKSNVKTGVNNDFNLLDQRIIWQNWYAFTSTMKQGNTLDVCKRLLFQKMKPEKNPFKGLSTDRKMDEVSQVGV
uniref:Non-structural protein 2 n=1 Tax=Rotavirus A (strain RVA/SA11-Patton/G3P[X]) TaxID=36434 RepID=NSP2_ROTSP|nr:RecName: Full=Non-structural protein 2; Short=NSP2; AltName: Full=NCVP3; AltName: Full=Non-structural RNA-binding protein 35; Short=NS35 [Simian 11 rotavirus (serotype 3 / strain SA11-Patton)]AAA47298.1 nonstructural protein [Rotavirus sp.]